MLIKREANGQFERVEISLGAKRADTRKRVKRVKHVERESRQRRAAAPSASKSEIRPKVTEIDHASLANRRASFVPATWLARWYSKWGTNAHAKLRKLMRPGTHPLFSMRLTRGESSMLARACARGGDVIF